MIQYTSIDEAFQMIKSQFDARPVYLPKEDTINSHFVICNLVVLLTKLFQIYTSHDKYGTEEIFDFIHDYLVAQILGKNT